MLTGLETDGGRAKTIRVGCIHCRRTLQNGQLKALSVIVDKIRMQERSKPDKKFKPEKLKRYILNARKT